MGNGAADALSRVGKQFEVAALSACQLARVQEVINSYATDADAQELLHQLTLHNPDEHGYELYRGTISAVGGHSGSTATYQRVRKHFDWRGLKRDVDEFVQQCAVCQQAKHEHVKPPGLLAPLPIPAAPWEDLTMDFV
nr:uncharacterized protein LOC109741791 [Aegilops tauschii subsp. strangulata]